MTHWLRLLHRGLGLVPFVAMLATAGLVSNTIWQLGYLPGGNYPASGGWDTVGIVAFILFFALVYAAYAWSALTFILLVIAPRELQRNAISIGLCLLGIAAYVALLQIGHVSEWILG